MDATWLSDLGMVDDDYYNKSADQWNNVMRWMQDDGDDQFLSHDIASVLHANCYNNNNNNMQPCLSSESHSSKSISNNNSWSSTTADETNICEQTMNWKTTSNIMCEQQYSSSSNYNSQLLCFEKCNTNNNNNSDDHDGITKQRFYGFDQCGNTNKKEINIEESDEQKMEVKRAIPQVRDHIMAERKRREKLSQSFIALSALVPGLKKMDKASVLMDAIKYVKELKERVRMLELEQHNNKRRKVESVVVVKKSHSHVCNGDEDSSTTSCDDNNAVNGEAETSLLLSLPEVEARVSHKDVLIRIFCHQHKGLFVKLLSHLQNHLHLHVLNSCVFPFAHSNLDLTIIAQMGEDYSLTLEDLVKNLRFAILSLSDVNQE